MLRRCDSEDEVRRTLKALPESMHDIYDRLLSDIPDSQATKARKALQWLAYSERPLHIEEVAEAAILGPLGSLNIKDRFASAYDIVDICSSLVAVSPGHSSEDFEKQTRIAFQHPSAKEFLLDNSLKSPRAAAFAISENKAQTLICHACLSYLLMSTGISDSPGDRSTSYPLLSYAATYWYRHLVILSRQGKLRRSITALAVELFDTKRSEHLLRGIDDVLVNGPEDPNAIRPGSSCFPTPLYYASILGISDVVVMLIERGDDVNAVGGYCGSPLHAAAFNGKTEILHSLLDHGAKVDSICGYFGSVLQIASYRGHGEAVHILLDLGADVNLACGYYGSALQAAAAAGCADEVQLLIEYGANVNARGAAQGSALIAAAEGAHKAVVQMLLENGADPNGRGSEGTESALYAAAARGHSSVVGLLIDAGSDLNFKHDGSESSLTAAARGGHKDAVELLMRAGANIESKDSSDMVIQDSALHAAVQGGHISVVELLLRRRLTDINSKDQKGRSPLMKAAACGHTQIVLMLLNKGASIRATDSSGSTALMIATDARHEGVVDLLIQRGADPSVLNPTARLWDNDSIVDDRLSHTSGRTDDIFNSDSSRPTIHLELTEEQIDILMSGLSERHTDKPAQNPRNLGSVLQTLQKQLDTSKSGGISRPGIAARSNNQRVNTFGLDAEFDPTQRIPLSKLQRAFSWESDDDDNGDAMKDPRRK